LSPAFAPFLPRNRRFVRAHKPLADTSSLIVALACPSSDCAVFTFAPPAINLIANVNVSLSRPRAASFKNRPARAPSQAATLTTRSNLSMSILRRQDQGPHTACGFRRPLSSAFGEWN
jgi:hypothetical protein